MSEKCFCHFNGYAVKDATARKNIEEMGKHILPNVNTSDNGKILFVNNGTWQSTNIAGSPIATYIDEYISSALGGDY